MDEPVLLLGRHRRTAVGYLDVQLICAGRQRDRYSVPGLIVICVANRVGGGFSNAYLHLSCAHFVKAQLCTYPVHRDRNERDVAEVTVDSKAETLQEIPPSSRRG